LKKNPVAIVAQRRKGLKIKTGHLFRGMYVPIVV